MEAFGPLLCVIMSCECECRQKSTDAEGRRQRCERAMREIFPLAEAVSTVLKQRDSPS